MNYKKGDRIEIKTWEKMEEEHGLNHGDTAINGRRAFYKIINRDIIRLNSHRYLTISRIYISEITPGIIEYGVKEFSYIIDHEWIKNQKTTPINSRFDILDIR